LVVERSCSWRFFVNRRFSRDSRVVGFIVDRRVTEWFFGIGGVPGVNDFA
jgi:hypothetical protein